MSKSGERKRAVVKVLAEITHQSEASFKSNDLLKAHRINQPMKLAIERLIAIRFGGEGLKLTQPIDRALVAKAKTVGELQAAFADAAVLKRTVLKSKKAAPAEIVVDVKLVIARFVHITPGELALTDTLERWHFNQIMKRALGQSLNLFYKNEKNIDLKPLIHPSEIDKPDITVAAVVGVVKSRF